MKKKLQYDAYEDAQRHIDWYFIASQFIQADDTNGEMLDEGTLKTNISMYLADSVITGQLSQAREIKRKLQSLGFYDQAIQIIRESSVCYVLPTINKF